MNNIIQPQFTVLYTVEKTIKEYRKFCQTNISYAIKDITVDQALVLLFIDKNPEMSQSELSRLVFKDYASITRIIELMVKKGYLSREVNPKDRRRSILSITKKGKGAIKSLEPIILYNREMALKGLEIKQLKELQKSLDTIIANCT